LRLSCKLRLCIRRAAKWLWIRALFVSGLLWWAKRQLGCKSAVVVLTFHRVLTDHQYSHNHSQDGMCVREHTFEELIRHISRHYELIDVRDGLPGPSHRSRPRFAITFDDGWLDTYVNAFPILLRNSAPATVFVCPGLAGRERPFWPEEVVSFWKEMERLRRGKAPAILSVAIPGAPLFDHVDKAIDFLKRLSPEERNRVVAVLRSESAPNIVADGDSTNATMTWDQISAMNKGLINIGSHTMSHEILTNVTETVAAKELCDSKRMIEARLDNLCSCFAYPNGDFSSKIQEVVASSGYQLAFSTKRGAWTPESDPLAIPRVHTWEANISESTGVFSQLTFEYTIIWTAYRNMRRQSNPRNHPAAPCDNQEAVTAT
jgi:peptidoglycan/xylan/chitin deacetylase (PgdA/CDA1 family)